MLTNIFPLHAKSQIKTIISSILMCYTKCGQVTKFHFKISLIQILDN